jgi:hypothetical protein
MNPEDTLARMRAAVRQIQDPESNEELRRRAASELAELFGDLDQWMQSGGFVPASWRSGDRRDS